jgi:uncharacterized protein (DUF1810 family)
MTANRTGTDDPYDLQRFLDVQEGVYTRVLSELRDGQKRSHWIWYVFPQIQGLGHSSMARRYAISSLAEAKAYLNHPILGMRLRECTRITTSLVGRSIDEIFGFPDDLKFRSSMTLFAKAAAGDEVFTEALAKYFAGEMDSLTLERL